MTFDSPAGAARRAALALFGLLTLSAAVPAAAEFPPLTDRERTLASVPNHANAPAVVLFRNAELWVRDVMHDELSSRMHVQARTKVLTDKGMDRAEVQIAHSGFVRLKNFQGRTILPDGKIVPVPADAKFQRKLSKREGYSVTSVAFPAVAVGAILDYEYELVWDSLYHLDPWFFSDAVPVLHSEIVYHVPPSLAVRGWNRDPFKVGVKNESEREGRGTRVKVSADNLPAIPDEPFGFPFRDLATQVLLIPKALQQGADRFPLLEDWSSASKLLLDQYDTALGRDGSASRKARELLAAGSAGPTQRGRAAVLYRFVRDEIESDGADGVLLAEHATVDTTLRDRRGDSANKALLLVSLLKAAKIPARPVWAAGRDLGTPDLETANPNWFNRVLVAAELDGQRVFLDPEDRELGFGHLRPDVEGTRAVIPDRKRPEVVTLPETPWEQNARRSKVELAVDEKGRLAGTGELRLTGQDAWTEMHRKDESATTPEAWTRWLEERTPGFQISAVQVEESVDDRTVLVQWSLAQREENVLGDEVSLRPSRPLGPLHHPFTLPAEQRRTPVAFAFADRDEVELHLRWPEGWKLEGQPQPGELSAEAGAYAVKVEVDEAARQLVYRRRFDLSRRELANAAQYTALRNLYSQLERSDAQTIALARP